MLQQNCVASLANHIISAHSNYDHNKSVAKEKYPNADSKDNSQRKIIRITHVTLLEESSETVQLNGKRKFLMETLNVLPIISIFCTIHCFLKKYLYKLQCC